MQCRAAAASALSRRAQFCRPELPWTVLSPVQILEQIPKLCVLFHESVQVLGDKFLAKERRHVYVTPTSYLELSNFYKKMLGRKQDEVGLGCCCMHDLPA